MATLDDVDRIQGALSAQVDKFHLADASRMSHGDWKAYRRWVREYYDYLRQRYADAINECDSIIGKQWHFDNIGRKLPPEHGSG